MITKKERKLEYIEKGKDSFVDKRGKIENYKLSEKVNLVATISKAKYNEIKSLSSHSTTKMLISKWSIHKCV